MFTLVESVAAQDRLAAAADFVRSFEPGTELLLIGATREAIDDFAREIATAQTASFGWHRFSLVQFAAVIAQPLLATRGLVHMMPVAQQALAARATVAALREHGLPFLAPVARSPGFTRALASTLDELRSAAIAAGVLDQAGGAGVELAYLLTAFESQLAATAVVDRAALFATATEAVRAAAFVPRPLLLLDIVIDSRCESDFVAALVTSAGAAMATVPFGDERTRRWLQSLATDIPDPPRPSGVRSLDRLRRYLFSDQEPPAGDNDESVKLFSAPGEQRECVEIARGILDASRSGTRFDDIAVFLRSPETYTFNLEHALQRASIPAYFARGTRRPDPAGRAFLALLACAAERLSAKRFAEYLSLAQVPDAPTVEVDAPVASAPGRPGVEESSEVAVTDGTLRTPWRWEELLVEAAVIGGRDRWKRRLGGLKAQLQAQLVEAEAQDPQAPRVAAIDRERRNLDHLARFALPLVERLEALPLSATWGPWLDALAALAPYSLRQPQRVLDLLEEMRPMSDVGPVSLDEVRDVLAQRLTTLEGEPPSSRYGCVFVAAPEQARGRHFSLVFVPGLAERIFPQRPREDPLLLDELRRCVSEDLVTQDDRAHRERLQLRLAVGAATQRVVLSYPRVEVGEGRPRVPSFYALDIERAVSGRVPDYEELQRVTAAVADARLAWPAPAQPEKSIDDIEHDLSVLGRLLHRTDPNRSQGRARYLLELNSYLARSLRSRWARWESKKWQAADGLIDAAAEVKALLATRGLGTRAYSVSALQRFADCPYQFFLAAIVGLQPRDDPSALERIDPLTRGRIVHAVQAELLRALQREERMGDLRDQPDAARARLDELLDSMAERFRDDLAPAIDRVWVDEINSIRTDLRVWLQHFAASAQEWEPLRFELGFGLSRIAELDTHSVATAVQLFDQYRLRGAVDLIERHRRSAVLRVTDYKTGKDRTPPNVVVGGGSILQPVLYSLAVEAALEAHVTEARLFFCTAAGGFSERVVRIDDDARKAASEVLRVIEDAVATGVLPPAPREQACGRCDFREVCGPYEEDRVKRKQQTPLQPLMTLRGLP